MRALNILPPLLLLIACRPAMADESVFLQSLAGSWNGKGTVITRIGKPAINVDCRFNTTTEATSVAMKGVCRGLLVVSRSISAELTAKGAKYSGIYVGPSGGRSALSGNRRGSAINLSVRWSKNVNGDRTARMMIERVGANGLRLRTVDRDHSTGRSIATSDILLQRS
jgi:hypothetical protein